jgi:prolyl 4-hydroxylase
MYRAAIGEYVRKRLSRTPNAYQVPVADVDMFVVRDFLTPEECAGLMELIDAGRYPSGVLSDVPNPEYRTSESCNLDPRNPLVATVEARISKLMGIQPEHGEAVQGQRYAVGQEFKPHHDFFYTTQNYWLAEERAGGQRTWTAMIFLNEPEAGGQTYFTEIDIRISPRAGNLFAWNNMDSNGEPNPKTMHQGMPVTAGVKYIVTKWYRERPWGAQLADVTAEARSDRRGTIVKDSQ